MKPLIMLLVSAITLLGGGAIQMVMPISAQDSNEPVTRTAIEELGRLLFWDPILSGNRDIACVSCHHPAFAHADGRPLSLGTGSAGLGPERTDTTGGVIPVARRNSPPRSSTLALTV